MRTFSLATLLAIGSLGVLAQRPQLSDATRAYVTVDTPSIALVNARVIDGTGAPAREGQTLLIQDGTIAEIGDSGTIAVPAGADVDRSRR